MRKLILLALICFSCNLAAFAQQGNLHSYGVFYDEDQTLAWFGLRKLNEDRNYTLGLGPYFSYPALHNSWLFAPLELINSGLGRNLNNSGNAVRSLMISNGSFTPGNISSFTPITDDRPYGSITQLQTATTFVDNVAYRKFGTTFSVGVLGMYIAREFQTTVHKIGNWQLPNGWKNQISDTWEPTLLVSYSKERLINRAAATNLLTHPVSRRWGVELKQGWRATLGYYTEGNYLFSIRAGKIDPRNWGYDVTPLFASNKRLGTPIAARYSEYYLFATGRPYFVLYNALLNGQFVKSVHTFPFQQMQHLILEFDAGAGVNLICGAHDSKSIDLKLKLSGHSPEFKVPTRDPRWHYYVGIDVVYNYW